MDIRRGIVAFSLILLAADAAGAKVRTVKSLDGIEAGRQVRMEGVVSVRGSTPLTMLVLEIDGYDPVTVRPHTAAIQHELTHLDGVRIAVEGEVLPLLDAALPRLDVNSYEILVAPGGDDPVVGIVAIEDDACILTTNDGRRYWITGELAPALCLHAGARVWIVGKKAKRADGKRPSGTTAFTPSGYGVIE